MQLPWLFWLSLALQEFAVSAVLCQMAQGEGAPLRQFRFRFLDTPVSRILADDGGILENQVCTFLAACFTCGSLPHVQPAFVYTLKLYHSHPALPGEFVCSLLLCSLQLLWFFTETLMHRRHYLRMPALYLRGLSLRPARYDFGALHQQGL